MLVWLERSVTAYQYQLVLTVHFSPFYLFHNNSTLIYRAQGPSVWFNEDENNINHMLGSPHLNPVEHLWDNLEQSVWSDQKYTNTYIYTMLLNNSTPTPNTQYSRTFLYFSLHVQQCKAVNTMCYQTFLRISSRVPASGVDNRKRSRDTLTGAKLCMQHSLCSCANIGLV